ncbi:MAG: Ser-Thr-rich GPI-anchored membrane family protein, partial [Candidatus Omnitrophota bacterium]
MSKTTAGHIIRGLLLAVCAVSIAIGTFCFLKRAYSYQVKRVVRGSFTFPSTNEAITVDLSSYLGGEELNLTKSLLLFDWRMTDEERNKSDHFGLIDDPTNLLFARWTSGTTSYIEWKVAEFVEGVEVISGATVVPETTRMKNITLYRPVNLTRAFPVINWRSSLAANTNDETNVYCVRFKNNQTIQLERIENATNANNEVSYQVVEFDRDVRVLNGSTEIPSGQVRADANLSATPFNASKSFLYFTTLPGSTSIGGIEAFFAIDGYIVNDTALRFERGGTSYNTTAWWYVVEFQNNAAFSKNDRTPFSTAQTIINTTFTDSPPINLTRTISTGSASLQYVLSATLYERMMFSNQLSQNGSNIDLSQRRQSSSYDANASYSLFEFPPLDVIAPNGGENWTVNQTQVITWKHADSSKNHNMDIRLCKGGCNNITNYTTLINTTNASLDSYSWKINNTVGGSNPIGDTLKVAIVDTNMTSWANTNMTSRNWDISNADFRINGSITLTAPNDDSGNWRVGDINRQITWDKTGNLSYSTFNISLYTNGGTTYNSTIQSALNPDTVCTVDFCAYGWNPLPDIIRKDMRVKITLNADANVTDMSNSNFSIKPNLTITRPNNGSAITW